MNEQSNTRLVQQAYHLFKEGNIQFLNLLAADVL
jgi:hypothetical protein